MRWRHCSGVLILMLLACAEQPESSPRPPAEPCVLEPGGSCVVVGTGIGGFGDEGPATETDLFMPQDVTAAPDGAWYVLDYNNHRVLEVVDGWATILAGGGFPGDGPEGPATEASLNHPTSAARDGERLVVAGFHSARVYAVAGGWLENLAGDGFRGEGGDGGPATAASLNQPSSVAVGSDGTIYVADQGNAVIRTIRDGVIDRLAGTTGVTGYTGDGGPALDATLGTPAVGYGAPAIRIALDEPLLYVADEGNGAVRVIDLDTGRIDTRIGPADGLDGPSDLAIGPDGTLYVADVDAHCVLAFDGVRVETFAGTCGSPGSSPSGAARDEVRFHMPTGVEVTSDGTVLVADFGNHVVRALLP